MTSQTTSTPPKYDQRRWLRIGALILGIITFVWLSPEDDSVLPALLLGVSFSTLVAIWLLIRLNAASWIRGWQALLVATLFGVLVGGGTCLSTVMLLLLKNARHAHLYPDYPPELLLDTLARFPAWSAAGGLMGIGLLCLSWVLKPE